MDLSRGLGDVYKRQAQGDDRSSRLFLTFVHALEKTDERA
jgi:hypothetical protein